MKAVPLVAGAALVAVLGASAVVRSQEKEPPKDPVSAAWEKAGAVGEQQGYLKPMVGTFDASLKVWMDPSQPPVEQKGTSEYALILGGRFLEQRYKGEFMGEPFEGRSLMGYDNVKKKFQSLWVDNTYTGFFSTEGDAKDGGKTFELHGSFVDPLTGKEKKARAVVKVPGPDAHTYESFERAEDGKEVKTLEVVYTRRK